MVFATWSTDEHGADGATSRRQGPQPIPGPARRRRARTMRSNTPRGGDLSQMWPRVTVVDRTTSWYPQAYDGAGWAGTARPRRKERPSQGSKDKRPPLAPGASSTAPLVTRRALEGLVRMAPERGERAPPPPWEPHRPRSSRTGHRAPIGRGPGIVRTGICMFTAVSRPGEQRVTAAESPGHTRRACHTSRPVGPSIERIGRERVGIRFSSPGGRLLSEQLRV